MNSPRAGLFTPARLKWQEKISEEKMPQGVFSKEMRNNTISQKEQDSPTMLGRMCANWSATDAGMRLQGYRSSGKVNQKVLPCRILLSTPILPPCASTASRQKASPSPVPNFLFLFAVTWPNFSKTLW